MPDDSHWSSVPVNPLELQVLPREDCSFYLTYPFLQPL
jgi:hypothetical protein